MNLRILPLKTLIHDEKSPVQLCTSPLSNGSELEGYSTSESSGDMSDLKSATHSKHTKNPKGYTQKLKTEMCKTYSLGFVCPYGDLCSFAHGEAELRKKVLIPSRYKTVKCRDFHGKGFCNFGLRCQFLHMERSKKRPTQLKKMAYRSVLETLEQAVVLKPDESIESLISKNLGLSDYRMPKLSVFREIRSA